MEVNAANKTVPLITNVFGFSLGWIKHFEPQAEKFKDIQLEQTLGLYY